ncbi:MAG TPA: cation:proton antiporter [Noviherbaspirillum sp.]|jgi:Kef-type K+ transport system membrane component KefB|uniref:cation:proton antiporter n=1 Tax=Noviherbaspirillum sp. TaxID=1926288 RepID=UPI002F939810
MTEIILSAADLVWPLAFALAWVLGELGHRFTGLPRVSVYALTGFLLSFWQTGFLPRISDSAMLLLANIAFGLILFEFGYRINLRWLRTNLWIGVSGVVEAALTFALVYFVAHALGMPGLQAMLLAALAIPTSPAELMRVVNERRSSGQVTERALHLSALNCFLAVFAFNLVVGLWTFESSGSAWGAVSNSLLVLLVSGALGAVVGLAVPGLLRKLGTLGADATLVFALAVILLAALAQTLKVSPMLAALTCGCVARHRRVTLNQTQRNFGVLGDLLTVLLFVVIGAGLSWARVYNGLAIGLALLAARFAGKLIGTTIFAHASGTSWRKGVLSGIALSPMSVLVVLLLLQTRQMGVDLLDQLAPLSTAALFLAIGGPILAQWALRLAHETSDDEEQ